MNKSKIRIYYLLFAFLIGCSSIPLSDTKENLEKALFEKAERVGFYLAASKQAEREGYSELAVYLGEVAEEEVKHLNNLSVLLVKLEKNTKKNLKKLQKIEKRVSRHTYPEMARIARDEGKEEIAALFEEMTKDEERHYLGIKGILKKIE